MSYGPAAQPAREPEVSTIKRGGGKPPDLDKPSKPLVSNTTALRRALGLAMEWKMNGESAAWLAASSEDRLAAGELLRQATEKAEL